MIPEDDRSIFSCVRAPAHYSMYVDKFKYERIYKGIFGGVIALKKEQYIKGTVKIKSESHGVIYTLNQS